MNRLEQILAHKRLETTERQRLVPLVELEKRVSKIPPAPSFVGALRRHDAQPVRLIAEIKRASPSRGMLAASLRADDLAQIYRSNGATAISVLTDERFFCGSLDDLRSVAALPDALPVLRKDFILSPYQLLEARAAGAAAALLIAACLSPAELRELHAFAHQIGLDVLIEVHTPAELEKALECDPVLIGVNNRDLTTFEVRLETSLRLIERIPVGIVRVAESGIHTPQDARRLAEAGFDALLVGEALVTSPDPGKKLRELLGRAR